MIWNADSGERFVAALLLALFSSLLCNMALRHYLKWKELPPTAHITVAVAAVFLCLHGFSMEALRSILLCQVLIMAGACDAATYEIPDFLHLLIAMAGLMGFQTLPALLGFLLVPLPFLIAAVKTDKIGGGDVKLMAASGFALGVTGGVWMMVWGLFMGLLWNAAFRREKPSIPLAPFLAFGCFMVLLST
ncbi:A24 family peptidase [Butyricicoccus faecihominis]|uniref:prepilin peptidase n=1 Tax=Butyricicoccus faecihominis TaxID=1712515 RepID=UPI0024798663|nr:A24 family peptidase [Butyricicoccus faecihominis]MCQ5128915.1 A24 family peptidase [Butyricicoccus faecihominis]